MVGQKGCTAQHPPVKTSAHVLRIVRLTAAQSPAAQGQTATEGHGHRGPALGTGLQSAPPRDRHRFWSVVTADASCRTECPRPNA